jgi:hypothetical protein
LGLEGVFYLNQYGSYDMEMTDSPRQQFLVWLEDQSLAARILPAGVLRG